MSLVSDRVAYETLWRDLLTRGLVVQCPCGRTATTRRTVPELEHDGWQWRLEHGHAWWTCPECKPS